MEKNVQTPQTLQNSNIKIETLNKTSLKSSQEKNFRKQVLEQVPRFADILDKIWPKKATLLIGRQKPYTSVFFINDEPCFVQVKDGPIVPHLRLLHKCNYLNNILDPFLLPTCQVDKGAIPFIIGGANVMIPGMTSPAGILPDVKAEHAVAILCEGKQNALAIGTTTMSPADMKRVNKGIGLELITFVGDDAWNVK